MPVRSCGGVRACTSTSSRIMFLCYKNCVQWEPALLHKGIQVPGLSIRHRKLLLRPSFLKNKDGKGLGHEMGYKWTCLSSSSLSLLSIRPSLNKSEMEDQVQDHPHGQQPNPENGVYFADECAYCNSGNGINGLSKKEMERRRKIGAANKGKVPWTKGRKLTEEHKRLVRQRTREALSDPKVRMKMLGHRQLHREESKEKISTALRKIWETRIHSFKSRQKVLGMWSNSIAEAAKQGGHGEDKMDWDSYDRIKAEMISVYLWNKERAKIVKKLKALTAKIAKKLEAAERRKLQNREAKKSTPEKLVLQQSDVQQKKVAISTRPKLKEKLTKWHDRKKELEIAISLRKRRDKGLRKTPLKRTSEERQEANNGDSCEVLLPSGSLSWREGPP